VLTPPPANADKSSWRSWAKAVRRELVTPASNRRVAAALRAWPGYQRARRVLVYLAFGSEVDLTPLLSDPNKTFYLTRTVDKPQRDLTIHRLEPGRLERHRLEYLQPSATAAQVAPMTIELALVPGLLFDQRGGRLGYGLGYFDRLLPRLAVGTARVGVTLEALIVGRLPTGPLDAVMTHLATEDGVREVAKASREKKPHAP